VTKYTSNELFPETAKFGVYSY